MAVNSISYGTTQKIGLSLHSSGGPFYLENPMREYLERVSEFLSMLLLVSIFAGLLAIVAMTPARAVDAHTITYADICPE